MTWWMARDASAVWLQAGKDGCCCRHVAAKLPRLDKPVVRLLLVAWPLLVRDTELRMSLQRERSSQISSEACCRKTRPGKRQALPHSSVRISLERNCVLVSEGEETLGALLFSERLHRRLGCQCGLSRPTQKGPFTPRPRFPYTSFYGPCPRLQRCPALPRARSAVLGEVETTTRWEALRPRPGSRGARESNAVQRCVCRARAWEASAPGAEFERLQQARVFCPKARSLCHQNDRLCSRTLRLCRHRGGMCACVLLRCMCS